MARRVGTKTTKKEFKDFIAATAAELRQKIEAEVTGLDDRPSEIAARRARALAPDGYEFFARTYFPHYIKSASSSSLHRHLYKRLPEILTDPRGQNDAIAAPRGEAKSTHCSQLFPLWCIAKRAKHFILVLMDAFDQSATMVEAIKAELESNPRLALDFPEICGQGRVWKEGVIVTRTGVKVQAFGSGKRLRGLRHGPYRPDLAILDDIENDENVRSVEQRDKLEGWVDKAVLNVGAADGSLDVLYIGTILHYDSVLSRKLRNPMWRAIKFASVLRWPDRMDLWEAWEELLRNEGLPSADAFYVQNEKLMTAGAEVSWPEVRPIEALMRLRVKIGTAAFDAEQQNDPVSETDAIFGTITFWVERSDWIFFGACDPSLGKHNKGRDPSAILVGGLNRETGILDVVEASIRKRLPDRIISDVIALQKEYRCMKWAIEAIQFQEFFRTELVKRSAKDGTPVPAVAVTPNTDKALRIECLQPHVANGLIRLHPTQTTLLQQMRHYPMVDHDDGPDALEMLWMIALSGSASAGVTVEPEAQSFAGGLSRMFARSTQRMFGR
jgi:predicted phage terminase large subunit-like protein